MTRAVSKWNETPASNNFDIDEGGAPENHQRVKVNNSVRERMAAVAIQYHEIQGGYEWLDLLTDPLDRNIPFAVSRASSTTIDIVSGVNDLSAIFNLGRRLLTTTAGVATDSLRVLSVVYANPTTTVTIDSTVGLVTAGIDGCLQMSISSLGKFAFLDSISSDYIVPETFDDAGIDAALVLAAAAGGGTILLGTGTYNLTTKKTVADNVRFLGQGKAASILQWTGVGGVALLDCGSNCGFAELTIEDLGTAGGGGDRHMIYRSGAAENAVIRDVELVTPVGNGIYFTGAGVREHIIISGVDMHHPGWSGIVFDDVDTSAKACSISDVTVDEPGFGGTGARYGLDLAGVFTLANISVINLDSAGPAVQTGLRFKERIAVSPNEQDARDCTLASLLVTGTGANAVGLRMDGRHCAVVGGAIELEGVASIGVSVGGTLGQQFANNNKVAQLSITAAIGYDETNTIARRNMLSNCVLEDCGVDVRLAAGDAQISGNIMDGATVGSVLIQASCLRPTIQDNRISNFVGVGVEVKALAANALIEGNRIHDGAAGIELEGTSTGSRVLGNMLQVLSGIGIEAKSGTLLSTVSGNSATAVSGADYLNSAGSGAIFLGNMPIDESAWYERGSNLAAGTGTPPTAAFAALAYPQGDGGPNGVLQYVVNITGKVELNDNDHIFVTIHSGALGTTSDPTLYTVELGLTNTSGGDSYLSESSEYLAIPSAGHTVSIGIRRVAGVGSGATLLASSHVMIKRRRISI